MLVFTYYYQGSSILTRPSPNTSFPEINFFFFLKHGENNCYIKSVSRYTYIFQEKKKKSIIWEI